MNYYIQSALALIVILFLQPALSAQNYCNLKSDYPWEEWISEITVNGTSNSSGKARDYGNAGYSNYTDQTINLTAGQTASYSFKLSFSGYQPSAYWRAWIDYNQDGTFTTDERVVARGNAQNVNGSFTVPAGARSGTTRLRIAMDSNNAPPKCGSFDRGEVEDYTVNISGSGGGGGPDLSLSNLSGTFSGNAGQVVNYNFNLRNTGDATTGNFSIKSYFSTDNNLSNNDIQDGIVPTGNIPPGFNSNVAGASTIPASLAPGNYYLIVKADADNQISESNENNNTISVPFTVSGGGGGSQCGFLKSYDGINARQFFRYGSARVSQQGSNYQWIINTIELLIANNGNEISRGTYTPPPTTLGTLVVASNTTLEYTPLGSNTPRTINVNASGGSVNLQVTGRAKLSNGEIILGYYRPTANPGSPMPFAIEISNNGTKRYQRDYTSLRRDELRPSVYFVSSTDEVYIEFDEIGVRATSILKIDNNGNIVWQSNRIGDLVTSYIGSVDLTDDEQFIYYSFYNQQAAVVQKLSAATGEVIWERRLDQEAPINRTSGRPGYLFGSIPLADGGVLAGFSAPVTGPVDLENFITRLDANGNFVWAKPSPSGLVWTPALEDDSGSLLFVAGQATFDDEKVYMLKVDENGNRTPVCQGTQGDVDLTISGIEYTSYQAANRRLTFTVDVANEGDLGAPGSFVIKVYNPRYNHTFDESDLVATIPSGNFGPNSSIDDLEISANLNFDPQVGSSALVVIIDGNDQVNELFEFNNTTDGFIGPSNVPGSGGGDGVDIEVTIETNTPNPGIYRSVSAIVTVENKGNEPASGVQMQISINGQAVYSGGSEYSATKGIFYPYGGGYWNIGTLAAGEVATMQLSLFTLTGGGWSVYGELTGLDQNDIDSSPGNGASTTEDDEAVVNFNGGSTASRNASPKEVIASELNKMLEIVAVYPNPVADEVGLRLNVKEDQTTPVLIYDQMGRVVMADKVNLEQGFNQLEWNVGDLLPGMYFIHFDLPVRQAPVRFIKVRL